MGNTLKEKAIKEEYHDASDTAYRYVYHSEDVKEAVKDYVEVLNFYEGKIISSEFQDILTERIKDKYGFNIWQTTHKEAFIKIFGDFSEDENE